MSISHNEILYNTFMEISLRLKELRLENGVTQKQLASKLNIKQNTYSQYESGQRQIPLNTLAELSMFYDVSVDYLLNLTDSETPYPRK